MYLKRSFRSFLSSSLFVLAPLSLSARGTTTQDVAVAVGQLKSIFEEHLVSDRLTREEAAAARATARFVAENALDPNEQALGRRALGEIARQLEDLATAEAELRAVLSLYPGSSQALWARYSLGLVYEKLGGGAARRDFAERALAEFRELLRSSPAHPVANRAAEKIGLIYLNRRDRQKAVQAYAEAIAKYPGTPGEAFAHGGLAQAYRGLRRWDEAIKHARLRAAFAGYPRCAMFQVVAGMALAQKGELAAAVAEFQKVTDASPPCEVEFRAVALVEMGGAYYQMKQYEKAIGAAERIIEGDYPMPYPVTAQLFVGRVLMADGRYAEASAAYEKVIAAAGPTYHAAAAQYYIGTMLEHAGDVQAALAAYRKVLTGYPSDPDFVPFKADAQRGIERLTARRGEAKSSS